MTWRYAVPVAGTRGRCPASSRRESCRPEYCPSRLEFPGKRIDRELGDAALLIREFRGRPLAQNERNLLRAGAGCGKHRRNLRWTFVSFEPTVRDSRTVATCPRAIRIHEARRACRPAPFPRAVGAAPGRRIDGAIPAPRVRPRGHSGADGGPARAAAGPEAAPGGDPFRRGARVQPGNRKAGILGQSVATSRRSPGFQNSSSTERRARREQAEPGRGFSFGRPNRLD